MTVQPPVTRVYPMAYGYVQPGESMAIEWTAPRPGYLSGFTAVTESEDDLRSLVVDSYCVGACERLLEREVPVGGLMTDPEYVRAGYTVTVRIRNVGDSRIRVMGLISTTEVE